jgi:outer membrane receptor protein involved in Fe transport
VPKPQSVHECPLELDHPLRQTCSAPPACNASSSRQNPRAADSDFTNLNALGLDRTYSGFRSRASLSWRLNEDAALYYTWSQGFRSGGFNRGFAVPGYSPLYPGSNPWQVQAHARGGWAPGLSFAPDTLTNNDAWLAQLYAENLTDTRAQLYTNNFLNYKSITVNRPRTIGLRVSYKFSSNAWPDS